MGPIVIGVDPGRRGAAVAISDGIARDQIFLLFNGKEFDAGHLAGWLKSIDTKSRMAGGTGIRLVVVERQSTRPGQGVVSSFKIGQNYGEIRGVVAALGMSMLTPTPAQWVRRMVGSGKRDKRDHIAACRRLIPALDLCPEKKRVAQDGIADAGLIGLYGEHWLKANA